VLSLVFSQSISDVAYCTCLVFSPEAVKSAITNPENEIQSLRGQYYDVSAVLKQIEAKQAFNAGDYVKANELAKGAVKPATPPYAFYVELR
jgi:hypothetical protein